MFKRSTLGTGTLVALGLLFIGLTIVFSYALRGWRIDLTENKLYSTAEGTNRILKNLEEPINLYFFFTPAAADPLPSLKTYATRVRELLEELVARSNGKLRLKVIDPQPFSEDEDRAAELGVRSVPVGSTGQQLYFGLAGTNSTDGRAAIEFFDPNKEEFLEYDVVKLIYQLSTPSKPVVGWLSGLPMQGGFDPAAGQPRQPWVVFEQAQQLFDVRPLDSSLTQIDPDINLLVIAHPKSLPPAALFAIDQFALRGGHVLAFVDPLAEQDNAGADPSNPLAAMGANRSSDLGPLFKAWGIEYDPKQIVADLQYALTVSMRMGQAPVRHLGILGLDQDSFNDKDVITSGLSNINVATAGHLKAKADSGVTFEPLLQTSSQAALLPSDRFTMLFDPTSLFDGFKATGERYTVGARVTGNVKTAFPDGPPSGAKLPEGQEQIKESQKPLNVVVFADTDMLSDFLWVRQQNFFGQRVAEAFAHNGDLVFNSLDNLAGSADLISVRGRATFTRPFKRVELLRAKAQERFRAKEQELEEQLRTTEEKLTALQERRDDKTNLILTPEQEKELERFQAEKLRIRKELREVRADLDQDIKQLGTTLKVLNIIVAPGVFALAAVGFAFVRRRRTQTAAPAAQNEKKEAHA